MHHAYLLLFALSRSMQQLWDLYLLKSVFFFIIITFTVQCFQPIMILYPLSVVDSDLKLVSSVNDQRLFIQYVLIRFNPISGGDGSIRLRHHIFGYCFHRNKARITKIGDFVSLTI